MCVWGGGGSRREVGQSQTVDICVSEFDSSNECSQLRREILARRDKKTKKPKKGQLPKKTSSPHEEQRCCCEECFAHSTPLFFSDLFFRTWGVEGNFLTLFSLS